MKENILTGIVSVILSVVLVGVFFAPEDGRPGRDGQDGLGAVVGPDYYDRLNVLEFQQGGGTNSIDPVDATYTLTAANMDLFNVITFDASTTQPALTVTLPASTTFPLGKEAGSYRSWVIENPFTAAATTTTIAAGTGIDLQEPDGQNVVIGINNYAFLTCLRELSTDIVCRVDETIPAD